jgi:hypothetical protein
MGFSAMGNGWRLGTPSKANRNAPPKCGRCSEIVGQVLAVGDKNTMAGPGLFTIKYDSGEPKAGEPEMFLQVKTNPAAPAFSPDGRWLA